MRFVWQIGGEAGYGIQTAGYILAKALVHHGLNVFTNSEYPSLIRGGHNTFLIRAETEPVFSHWHATDLLVALNKETIDLHKSEVVDGGAIIYDGANVQLPAGYVRPEIKLLSVPLAEIAMAAGDKIMANSAALGASAAAMGADIEMLIEIMDEIYGLKGKLIEENLQAARAGYEHVIKNYGKIFNMSFGQTKKEKMLLTGSDAIASGAIAAGCKFLSQYPMTPASGILHYMAKRQRDYNIVVIQPEDEIAAINMAIGASFAGVRSMTATSGGGYSLMVEATGLAAETEVPLVIIEGQRPGPSTGLPTRTEQGDLKFLLNASQGEFPRIIIAPGDVKECFYQTTAAFNLAERWQVPVIVMVDKFLCESYTSTDRFVNNIKIDRGLLLSDEELAATKDFKRYAITPYGVSPRSIPGQLGGVHRADSDEHDEAGNMNEEPAVRSAMQDKRWRKLPYILRELPPPKLIGSDAGTITFVGWGSTKGPILDAMRLLAADGIKTNFLQISYLSPFHADAITSVLQESKFIVSVENNKTGQLADLIREKTGIVIRTRLNKYDGRQFFPAEIAQSIKRVLR